MFNYIRTLISENRRRLITDDINLDLSYITDHIVAMAYPGEGIEGYYRNDYSLVKKFLDDQHKGHYKVYNLRLEKTYDLSRFECAANYPFLDHQAPPFRMIIEFCKDAWDWLSRDEHNVVVIHCKAGKGRTGTLVASLLLHLGEAKNATEAIELYGEKRTMDMKGVTIPSQKRYVHYYEFMLNNQALYNLHQSLCLKWEGMVISYFNYQGDFLMKIYNNDVCIYHKSFLKMNIERKSDKIEINLKELHSVSDDIKAVCLNTKGKVLFSFWLNVVFVSIMSNNRISLEKQDVDVAFRNKELDSRFSVQLTLKKI